MLHRPPPAVTWPAPSAHGHAHGWARRWAQQVLLLWSLCVAVAVASPLIKPQDLQLICSAAGRVLWVPLDASADDPPSPAVLGSHALDCPLCAAPAAPPPAAVAMALSVQALGAALHQVETSRAYALVGLLPPSRGPPRLT